MKCVNLCVVAFVTLHCFALYKLYLHKTNCNKTFSVYNAIIVFVSVICFTFKLEGMALG